MGDRYIHAADEHNGHGTRVLRMTVDGEPQVWVNADDFMDVQAERDDFRRAFCVAHALACAAKPDRAIREFIVNQGAKLGLSEGDAKAMLGVLNWAQAELDRTAAASKEGT